MQIHKNATQEELEQAAGHYARNLYLDILQLRLRAQLVIIFLCLFNPPSIFGFFKIGALLTAVFVCFMAWAYQNNEAELFHQALIWWYIWAATVYLLNFMIRALICRKVSTALHYYKDADDADGAEPIPHPHQYPLTWEKDAEGEHWQSIVLIQAPQRGLYAFELIIENFAGKLQHTPDFACACELDEIHGERIRYTAIHRLEAGAHWMPFALSPAGADAPPPTATFSQCNRVEPH